MNNEEMRKMWEEAANQNKQEKKPGIIDTVREKIKKIKEGDNSDAIRPDSDAVRRNVAAFRAERERAERERLKNKERDDSYNKYLDDHAKKYPEQADVVDNYRPNRYK